MAEYIYPGISILCAIITYILRLKFKKVYKKFEAVSTELATTKTKLEQTKNRSAYFAKLAATRLKEIQELKK